MSNPRKLSLWALSLVLVLGLHVGLALWSLYWRPQMNKIEMPPQAMMVELAPLPAAPAPVPPAPPEPVQPPEPEPQPKIVEAPKPKLELPPPPKPKPKPKPPKPKPPEPKPVPKVEPEPSETPPQEAPPETRTERSEQQPAVASQASSNPAPSSALPSWQSQLLGHLNRYKRYPDDARRRGQEGTVRLRFVVDGRGQVLSYELVGRSSSPALDRATLQMIRRAQPLPPPPPELLKDGKLEVVAPFVYSLERR